MRNDKTKKCWLLVSAVIHQVRVLLTKPNNLSSSQNIHVAEGEDSYKVSSDLQMWYCDILNTLIYPKKT